MGVADSAVNSADTWAYYVQCKNLWTLSFRFFSIPFVQDCSVNDVVDSSAYALMRLQSRSPFTTHVKHPFFRLVLPCLPNFVEVLRRRWFRIHRFDSESLLRRIGLN